MWSSKAVFCTVLLLFQEGSWSTPSAATATTTVSHISPKTSLTSKKSPKNQQNYRPNINVPSLVSASASASINKTLKTQQEEDDEDENLNDDSIWDSKPEEISVVNIQILDKISGKVIKRRIEVGQPLEFGGIKVTLNRCLKNAPEDLPEVYAFIEISERKSIFARWLFASSPSINLFEHPQYDVRVEF